MIVVPGEVKLKLEDLTKEQLVAEVLKLQRMLETCRDRDLRERLAELCMMICKANGIDPKGIN